MIARPGPLSWPCHGEGPLTPANPERSRPMPDTLPTFEAIRAEAYRLLGDAADWLRSDWHPAGTPLTGAQAEGRREALRLIAAAKTALNRAAGGGR